MGYLTNFIVYTLAMVGVIILALMVFKYSTSCKVNKIGSSKGLKVIDSLSLSARKTLYVIESGNERFLIAGDIDRTTLISKLEPNMSIACAESNHTEKNIGIHNSQKMPYNPVVRDLMEKIKR